MGEPVNRFIYTDRYDRKWIVRTWNFEFIDNMLVVFSLPVPGGMISLTKYGYTDYIKNDAMNDIKFMTDYVYLTYFGTFKKWNEYLALKDYLPSVLKDFSMSYENGKILSVNYKKLEIKYGDELQKVSDDSEMKLYMSYFKEKNSIVWDIASIEFWENKSSDNSFTLSREMKPEKGLPDSYFSFWKKLMEQDTPYNGVPYKYENRTYVKSIHPRYAGIKAGSIPEPDIVYTVMVGREGSIEDQEMKKRLDNGCVSTVIKE